MKAKLHQNVSILLQNILFYVITKESALKWFQLKGLFAGITLLDRNALLRRAKVEAKEHSSEHAVMQWWAIVPPNPTQPTLLWLHVM